MKTGKRETAWAGFAALLGLSVFAMASESPDIILARTGIVSALAFPIMLFVGAAFGMDWARKQTNLMPPKGMSGQSSPDLTQMESWEE